MDGLSPPRAKTAAVMIVHDPHRLEIRVHDRGADEAKASLDEVLADPVGQLGAGWEALRRTPVLHHGPAVHERPEIARERPVLLLHLQEALRVGDGRLDLEPVANDASILHEPSLGARSETRDAPRVADRERVTVVLAPS